MKFKVIEIFDSIDGEGIRTGQPVSFVRLAGCNLRCTYCDTLYSLFGEEEPCEYVEMTEKEIIEKLNPLYKRVTLTGGEPLISPDADKLVKLMCDRGFEVNIETNGAVDIRNFCKEIRDKFFFTIDYKLPKSGMEDKMIWENFLNLTPADAIKFVAGSEKDVQKMIEVVTKLKSFYIKMPPIFIGAVYGEYDLKKLTETVLKNPVLSDARVQIQLHKIIWHPDERGV